MPALAPGDDGAERSKRFRLTHMMETLAKLSGDVDAQVDVMAHDLSASWQFVRIGALLAEHDRHPDALAWAERGLAAFGAGDHRLIELLFELYHQLGRGGEAVALARRIHDEHPGPASYRDLAAQARRAGTWSTERDPAFARLRQAAEARRHPVPAPGRRPVRSWGPPADSSDLVEVLLWEKRADEAWAEAQVGGCSERLWVELARKREQRHPGDAIPIWQRQVERAADLKRNDGYREAVDLLQHIAKLMKAAGQLEAFAPYVAQVRARHRPKRNLMALLADRGW